MNEINIITPEIKTLGQKLHEAEYAIYTGKLSVMGLLQVEPIDVNAVEATRAEIHEARLTRNALRRQIEATRVYEIPRGGWANLDW